MNTTVLRYMLEFAVHGSAQKAAESLDVSRSSITRGIKKLEDEFGTQLFINTSSGAVPTYVGDLCLRYARKILRIDNDLRFDLAVDGVQTGNINIGMDINRTQRVLPFVLPAFHKTYPNVQVRLHEMRSNELEAALMNQLLDFAVISLPAESMTIAYRPLTTERFVLVAPKDDHFAKSYGYMREGDKFITLEKFRSQQFILGHSGQRSRAACDRIFEKAGFIPDVLFETHNNVNAAMLAYNGLAYAIVPESYLTVGEGSQRIEYFYLELDLEPHWTIAIATLDGEKLSHAASELISEIFRVLGDPSLS